MEGDSLGALMSDLKTMEKRLGASRGGSSTGRSSGSTSSGSSSTGRSSGSTSSGSSSTGRSSGSTSSGSSRSGMSGRTTGRGGGSGGGEQGGEDYAERGRELLARVNLGGDGSGRPGRYDDANAIYQHPDTGARLYVGNFRIATSRAKLAAVEGGGCQRIVFCQDQDGKMAFRYDKAFVYLPFSIGKFRSARGVGRDPSLTLAFFAPLFAFVDEQLGGGQNVLIHCLAGAHRAGTAGKGKGGVIAWGRRV